MPSLYGWSTYVSYPYTVSYLISFVKVLGREVVEMEKWKKDEKSDC